MPDFRTYVDNTIEILIDCELDQALTDPANLTVSVADSAGTKTVYVYGTDDEIEKLSQGRYKFFLETDREGNWKVKVKMWGGPYRQAATKDYIVTVEKTVFTE